MKNIIVIFSLVLFISSCSKDDDTLQINSKDLLGTWNLTETTTEGTSTSTTSGVSLESTYTSFGKNFDAQVVFTENPNKFQSSGSYTSVITTTTLGQSSTLEIPLANFIGSGDWGVNGTTLTTKGFGEESSAEIIMINKSTLKLKVLLDKEITNGGISQIIKGTVFYTLSK